MNLQTITLRNVVASGKPRPLVTAEVDKLAASIAQVGLIQPITVKPAAVIHGTAEKGWRIIAGHHRVAACRALGWTEIQAIVCADIEHLSAELIEIDENLCRAELTAAQRTAFTKRRKVAWEALNPVEVVKALAAELEVGKVCQPQVASGHGGARPQTKGFATSTAEATGQAARTTRLAIARADAIGEDLERLVGTSLDKGVELDALARLPASTRTELVQRAVAGEKVSARTIPAVPARPTPQHTPRSLIAALNSAFEFLLDSTGCKSANEVVSLVASTFEGLDEFDTALNAVLDKYQAVGGIEPLVEGEA